MYGSSVDEEGKPIAEGSGKIPVITGERVVGNELVDFDFVKVFDKEEFHEDRAVIVFKQSNGAFLRQMYFKSDDPKEQVKVSARILHIFSKLISKEQYYNLLGSPKNFGEFVVALRDKVVPACKATGLKLTLKVVYNKKGYTGLPAVVDFAELDGTSPSTLKTNPKYDFYVAPVATDMGTAAEEAEPLPF